MANIWLVVLLARQIIAGPRVPSEELDLVSVSAISSQMDSLLRPVIQDRLTYPLPFSSSSSYLICVQIDIRSQ